MRSLSCSLRLLEGDFFDLFGFREVVLGGQFVQAIFELVMLGGEVVEFLVGLQQLVLQIVWLLIHSPPPWSWRRCRTYVVTADNVT